MKNTYSILFQTNWELNILNQLKLLKQLESIEFWSILVSTVKIKKNIVKYDDDL